jgi:hypothetical protein
MESVGSGDYEKFDKGQFGLKKSTYCNAWY